MKKIILSSISLILVAAITLVALAATTGFKSNDKIDEVIKAPYDDGATFMTGKKAAPRYTDVNGLKAVDGDASTTWDITADGVYTQLTLDKFTSVNNIHITEVNSNIRKYHVEAWDGSKWVKVYNNDLIEGYYCASIDPIKTNAIRVVVDARKKGSTPKISEVEVSYQRPIEFDREFVNASYVSDNMFYHEYHNKMSPGLFDSLTDVIMIGNFCFDKDGKFVITQPNPGNATVGAVYPALSDNATMLVNGTDLSKLPPLDGKLLAEGKKGFIPVMKARYGKNEPRLHFSLTFTPFNGGTASGMTAFNDKTIRDQFIKDVVAFAKKHNFGGADIDWEYPSGATAWDSYRALVNDMSVALHAEGLLFSTAQSTWNMQLGAEAMNKFDTINMMSYDQINGAGQHSGYQDSTIKDINRYIAAGVKPEKLVLGTAWYSSQGQRGWGEMLDIMKGDTPEGEEIDPGINLIYSDFENGKVDYSFNNRNLLRDRVLYAVKRKLGGVFSWQMTCDVDYDSIYSLGRVQKETVDQYVTYVK